MKRRVASAIAASSRKRLAVRVIPNARKSEIAGWADGVLRVRLRAPAVEGQANEELIRFLAEAFGIRRSRIAIVHGEKSRKKTVEIEGWEETGESMEADAMRRTGQRSGLGGAGR